VREEKQNPTAVAARPVLVTFLALAGYQAGAERDRPGGQFPGRPVLRYPSPVMWTRLFVAALLLAVPAFAQQSSKVAPEQTEVWKPVPNIVRPGATDAGPPSDAIVLFGGKNEDAWVSAQTHQPARWFVHDCILTVNKGDGNIETKQRFEDYQLHLEWKIPENITGSGQARGNSGVFLASTGPGDDGYELQILDSYNNPTYVNGQAGSIYKQSPPLVNPNRKPGEWQTYDVIWTAPRFNPDGSMKSPAYVTVFFNGVLVQNHFQLKGQTLYIGKPSYKAYDRAPIKLQAHPDPSQPISFRNIWVRPLD
jgi:hypothetical protein